MKIDPNANPCQGSASSKRPFKWTIAGVMESSGPREAELTARLDLIRSLGLLFIVGPMLALLAGIVVCASDWHVLNAALWRPAVASADGQFCALALALIGASFHMLACQTTEEALEDLDERRAKALGLSVEEFHAALEAHRADAGSEGQA